MLPDNDIGGNIFFWKDLDTMISSTGLDAQKAVPFFIDASAAENPGGWPQGGVTLFDLPNNHLQYAITWYGLALALVFVAGFAYFRGAKGNRR
jgi:surfeit locus 1 family protein